jgi:3-oxoadipate enol-lactonase/4-carboxymuconolactone decarboxylase
VSTAKPVSLEGPGGAPVRIEGPGGAPVRIEGPGGAPVLVLANSLGASAAMWDAQMPVLRGRFRVVRYEHRGHGGTPAPAGPCSIDDLGADLLGVIDQVGAERVSIAGVSLGGMVAMWLAARHPERVERLVLACTAPQLLPARAWTERAATVRASGPSVLLETLLGRWFTPGFIAGRPDVAAVVADMLAQVSSDGYAGACDAIAAMDQWDDLARITAPTLVLAGASDPVCPPEIALRMHQAIAGSSLVVLPGASHLANIEQAERFTAALVDHLIGSDMERGRATRRAVLGDAHVNRSEAANNDFTAPFIQFLTGYAWGDVWTRPGLDRRSRSCVTLGILTALGRSDELALHVLAARHNGLSDAEISEILLHAAIYAGVPAANTAFAVARRVLEADDG